MSKRIFLTFLLSFASVPSVVLADPCFALVDAIFKEKSGRIEKALGQLSDVNCLPEGRNAKRKTGWATPLIAAIRMKNLPLMEQLLERGADPDMLARSGYPPVAFTAFSDETYVPMRELLGQAGANFNTVWTVDGESFNMFMDSWMSVLGPSQWSPAYVDEMLSRGVDPLWENHIGISLVIAVEQKEQILQNLQNAGPVGRLAQGEEDFETVKQILAEYLAKKEAREAEIARREEAARRRAEFEALEQRVEVQYQKDLALPADLRRDKYLVSINRHLRLEEYLDAAFFYALLDRNGEAVSGDALFFRGETYAKLGMSDKAMETFHEYAVKEGASGPYYVQALQESLRLTRTQHEESGGSDLGAFIAAGDRALDDLIRADKYTVGLSAAIQTGSDRDAVMFLRLIEGLGVVLDGSQQFYYAQSLLNLGEREQGIQKLYAYLNSEGSAGQHYARALELLAEFE